LSAGGQPAVQLLPLGCSKEGSEAVELPLAALVTVCAAQRGFERQRRPWQDSNLQPAV
jgi:hypothetical protein